MTIQATLHITNPISFGHDPRTKGVNRTYYVYTRRGYRLSLAVFAERHGIDSATLRARIAKWTIGEYAERFHAVVESVKRNARPTDDADSDARAHYRARVASQLTRGVKHVGNQTRQGGLRR